jgi:hypothetical protein
MNMNRRFFLSLPFAGLVARAVKAKPNDRPALQFNRVTEIQKRIIADQRRYRFGSGGGVFVDGPSRITIRNCVIDGRVYQ